MDDKKPRIEAVIGHPLTDKELEELMLKEMEFIKKHPVSISRYNNQIEKEIEEEIECAYRRVPAGTHISYLKGVEEFRYYLSKKYS